MTDEIAEEIPETGNERKPVGEMPDYWQQYLLCLLYLLLLPLLPIGIELFVAGHLKTSTLTITAALYAMGIAVTSKNVLEFGIYNFGSIIFALIFGMNTSAEVTAQNQTDPNILKESLSSMSLWNNTKLSAVVFIGMVFVFHALARYNRHIVYRQPFWEFLNKGV